MKMLGQFSVAVVGALLLAGCASMPNSYIPQTVGPLDDADPDDQIQVAIRTSKDTAAIGEPLIFTAVIRNIGKKPVWLPREPNVLFTWIYPNGRHDNFLQESEPERFYDKSDAVLLKPGEQIVKSTVIKTYYFERPGITEFRAVLYACRNTNPSLSPFWHGQLVSNAYGVRVEKAKKKDWQGGSFTEGQPEVGRSLTKL